MPSCRFSIEIEGHGGRSNLGKGEIAWFKMVPPLAHPCTVKYYLDDHLLTNHTNIGDKFGSLIFRGWTSDGQIKVESINGGVPNIRIVKTCPDCEAEATFNVIEIEVDSAAMVVGPGGSVSPAPTDPHFSPDLDYGWANIPAHPDQFGPEEHRFGSIGANGGSYIQNTTGKKITDIHIRVKNGKTIKRDTKSGGRLFPNVDYDPDGHGVTFSGGNIAAGDWIWMRMPKGDMGDYEGHLTPNK